MDPADFDDRNATIVSANVVTRSYDVLGCPVYSFLVVLNDGHMLISENIDYGFTTSLPSLGSERYVVKQNYSRGLASRRETGEGEAVIVSTLSVNEICSLINMNTEIYIERNRISKLSLNNKLKSVESCYFVMNKSKQSPVY